MYDEEVKILISTDIIVTTDKSLKDVLSKLAQAIENAFVEQKCEWTKVYTRVIEGYEE